MVDFMASVWSIPILGQAVETLKAAEMAKSWAELTPLGWIQAVGAFLLLVLVPLIVWLIRSMSKAQSQQSALLERLFNESGKQTDVLVDRIQEQVAQTRTDHRDDMRALFVDADKNRDSLNAAAEKIATKIEYLASQIHSLPKPRTKPGNGTTD
jgi:hypothetical protein